MRGTGLAFVHRIADVVGIVLLTVGAHTSWAQEPPMPGIANPKPPGPSRQAERLNLPTIDATSLEELMLEKGLLTQDDYIRLQADQERRAGETATMAEFTASPRWYERLRQYGYGMFRYNQLGNPNGQVRTYHDASVGDQRNGAQPGFFYRRIRWVVTGQVSEHVGIFFQPDLASNVSGNTHVISMRDAWGEWYFDKDKEFRFRVGLQRVPVSWDNWQASRQRMAIDRADATNSGAASERDMGISFQWTPKFAQQRWRHMIDYLYGAGDWGMINITVDNGQGLNAQETNKDKRVSVRLAYPFELPGGRLFEVGMNAYRQQFTVNRGTQAAGTTLWSTFDQGHPTGNYLDERLNFFIYYPPQPWGFLAEYVVGRGPERDVNTGVIGERSLYGGYVQGHYTWQYSDVGLANFYVRYQAYNGGLKFQAGAPSNNMQETEIGVAWMPDPQWEVTAAYAMTDRRNVFQSSTATATTPGRQFDAYGNLIRLQVVWFFN